MNPTDPTPLPCPFCGERPRVFHFSSGDVMRCEACGTTAMEAAQWNTRAPSAELAQAQAELEKLREMKRPWISAYEAIEGMWRAQAEAAAMREWVQESVVVSMKFADGRVLTKADLLATKHFLPTTTENTKPQ